MQFAPANTQFCLHFCSIILFQDMLHWIFTTYKNDTIMKAKKSSFFNLCKAKSLVYFLPNMLTKSNKLSANELFVCNNF